MIPKSYAQPLILADIEALCAAGAAETLEFAHHRGMQPA